MQPPLQRLSAVHRGAPPNAGVAHHMLGWLHSQCPERRKVDITAGQALRLGRESSCLEGQITGERRVSGVHCVISAPADADKSSVTLSDLSSNGTYVNGRLVGRGKCVTLSSGDLICLRDPHAVPEEQRGRISFVFTLADRPVIAGMDEAPQAAGIPTPRSPGMSGLSAGGCADSPGRPPTRYRDASPAAAGKRRRTSGVTVPPVVAKDMHKGSLAAVDFPSALGPFSLQECGGTLGLQVDWPRSAYSARLQGAPKRQLEEAGGSGALGGSLSPCYTVTLPRVERRRLGIPESATFFAWAYPPQLRVAGGAEDLRRLMRRSAESPELRFVLLGGYVYFDRDRQVLTARALRSAADLGDNAPLDRGLRFLPPSPWPHELTGKLREAGRFHPVTLPKLKERGAEWFCWLHPGEYPGAEHGAFVYLFADPSRHHEQNRLFAVEGDPPEEEPEPSMLVTSSGASFIHSRPSPRPHPGDGWGEAVYLRALRSDFVAELAYGALHTSAVLRYAWASERLARTLMEAPTVAGRSCAAQVAEEALAPGWGWEPAAGAAGGPELPPADLTDAEEIEMKAHPESAAVALAGLWRRIAEECDCGRVAHPHGRFLHAVATAGHRGERAKGRITAEKHARSYAAAIFAEAKLLNWAKNGTTSERSGAAPCGWARQLALREARGCVELVPKGGPRRAAHPPAVCCRAVLVRGQPEFKLDPVCPLLEGGGGSAAPAVAFAHSREGGTVLSLACGTDEVMAPPEPRRHPEPVSGDCLLRSAGYGGGSSLFIDSAVVTEDKKLLFTAPVRAAAGCPAVRLAVSAPVRNSDIPLRFAVGSKLDLRQVVRDAVCACLPGVDPAAIGPEIRWLVLHRDPVSDTVGLGCLVDLQAHSEQLTKRSTELIAVDFDTPAPALRFLWYYNAQMAHFSVSATLAALRHTFSPPERLDRASAEMYEDDSDHSRTDFCPPEADRRSEALRRDLRSAAVELIKGNSRAWESPRVAECLAQVRSLVTARLDEAKNSAEMRQQLKREYSSKSADFRLIYCKQTERLQASDAWEHLADVAAAADGEHLRGVKAQSTDELVTLYRLAAAVHRPFTEFLEGLKRRGYGEVNACPELKHPFRAQEKAVLRGGVCQVCDVVRGMIVCDDCEQMKGALEALLDSTDKWTVCRVKDRLNHPTHAGWSDIVVNGCMAGDRSSHICEVQLCFHKMLFMRCDLGGHKVYAAFRSAAELLGALGYSVTQEEDFCVTDMRLAAERAKDRGDEDEERAYKYRHEELRKLQERRKEEEAALMQAWQMQRFKALHRSVDALAGVDSRIARMRRGW